MKIKRKQEKVIQLKCVMEERYDNKISVISINSRNNTKKICEKIAKVKFKLPLCAYVLTLKVSKKVFSEWV